MSRILELFGSPAAESGHDWAETVASQRCPFLNGACVKIRKSQPDTAIGACAVAHGRNRLPLVICPHRLAQNSTVFVDCIHLLARHSPGNEFHLIPEVRIPGGSVDYFLASVNDRKVVDFVAIELQALDTTGTVWPERQRFLQSVGVSTGDDEHTSTKPFGINWKMSAKTILVQLHHKIKTLEAVDKRLALVVQDSFLDYMRREFDFDHVRDANRDDALQFHAYQFRTSPGGNGLRLSERLSTDSAGVERCLGLQASPNIALDDMFSAIERRLSDETLLNVIANAAGENRAP